MNNKKDKPHRRDIEWEGATLMVIVLVIFMGFLLAIFVADYLLARGEGEDKHPPLLTEAIIHTILGAMLIWIGNMVNYFFGMKQAQRQMREEAQRNGGIQK